MKSFNNSNLLEKSLVFIFLFLFIVFAFFFTSTNLKEIESSFNNERLDLTKKLAHEICDLIERRIDISAKLSNTLAENSVAYAVVHFTNGSLLARAEGYALPVGIFEIAESNALQSQFLNLFSFKDPSKRFSLIEAAMPIYTKDKVKYILRVGFLKNKEEEKMSYLKLRNILIFSLVFIFFISIRNIKYFDIMNFRYALLSSMTLVMLILFFVSAFYIREWYSKFWQNVYISKCISLSKMLIPNTINLIERNSSAEFEASIKYLKEFNDFESISVIRDDSFIYHSDLSKIGLEVTDELYTKSLNSNNPSVFKHSFSDNFTAIIPILSGSNRIGTLCTIWKNTEGLKYISSLRNILTIIFVFSYILLYWFIHIFSKGISENYLKQIDNFKEEFSYTKSTTLTEGDKIINSINGKSLSVTIFIYFSGLIEAIKKINSEKISNSIKKCYELTKKLIFNKKAYFELVSNGIFIVFNEEQEQNSIIEAIEFAKSFKNEISKSNEMYFKPKLTFNICKMLLLEYKETNEKPYFAGDSLIDYKTISKVQTSDEIITNEETYNYLKNIFNFEILEILSAECGKLNVYSIGDYKESNKLLNLYKESSDWTKTLIMRILKDRNDFDTSKLNELLEDNKS